MWRRALIVVAVLATAVGATSLVFRYWRPGSLYTLTLAAFSPYLAVGAVVGVLGFALVRGRTGWVGLGVAVTIVVWQVVVQAPLFVATSAPAGRSLSVLTANLKIGNGSARDVMAAVRGRRVDVIMFEEITPPEQAMLAAAGLDSLLPYHETDTRSYGAGTGIWSRFPLDGAEVSRVLGFSIVTARIRPPATNRSVELVAVHVFGPHPSVQFPRWHQDMDQLPGLFGELPDGIPMIVGGDFNATRDVSQFRRLLGPGFADAADQAGAGFTPTFPADRWTGPLIAIDHVLTRYAVATSLDSVTVRGSDHRALVARVVVPR